MTQIYKVILIAFSVIIINLFIKSLKSKANIGVTISASIVIMFFCISLLGPLIEFVSGLGKYAGISNNYLKIIFKCIGISVICDYTISLCKDFSETTIAYCSELASKLAVIYISLPMYTDVISIMLKLWES